MSASNSDQLYILQAQVFKALIHPVRLQILDLLRQNEACVCHMEAYLGYRQSYISQHLMVLKSVGIIEENRTGRNIFYQIKNSDIFTLLDSTTDFLGKKYVPQTRKKKACVCPKCNTNNKK